MAYQIQIKDFTSSSAKRITSANVKFTMGADAMWFSSNAVALVDEEVLSNSDLYWIVLEASAYVEIKFTADAQGQGFRIPSGLSSVQIMSVTGTVKRLKLKDGNYGITKATAYTDTSATTVAALDYLDMGDYLVFSSTGYAQIKLSAPDDQTLPFVAIPLGLLSNADR